MIDKEKFLQELRGESSSLRSEIKERTVGYIVGALGLVAGLAWNEAVKDWIEYTIPFGANSLLAKFIYAAIITILIVIISVYLVRWAGREKR